MQHAKEHSRATVLVGHVTKEGTIAGPRVLEHVVDTVLLPLLSTPTPDPQTSKPHTSTIRTR